MIVVALSDNLFWYFNKKKKKKKRAVPVRVIDESISILSVPHTSYLNSSFTLQFSLFHTNHHLHGWVTIHSAEFLKTDTCLSSLLTSGTFKSSLTTLIPMASLYQTRLPIRNSQNCSMFPLAFAAGSLQGHWWGFISRNYVVSPIFFLMNVFIALKGTHFFFKATCGFEV